MTGQNGLRLPQDRFGLDILESFFTGRVFKRRNMLPRKVAELPSLEVTKKCVDVKLRDLGW